MQLCFHLPDAAGHIGSLGGTPDNPCPAQKVAYPQLVWYGSHCGWCSHRRRLKVWGTTTLHAQHAAGAACLLHFCDLLGACRHADSISCHCSIIYDRKRSPQHPPSVAGVVQVLNWPMPYWVVCSHLFHIFAHLLAHSLAPSHTFTFMLARSLTYPHSLTHFLIPSLTQSGSEHFTTTSASMTP